MTGRLPLLGAQLGYALAAERSGRRTAIYGIYRMASERLAAADLEAIAQSVLRRNVTLSLRIGFHRGVGYQERCPAVLDFAELQAANEDAVLRRAAQEADAFEGDPDGPSMVVRLFRSPDADYVLLMCDHALVDGEGYGLILQQLNAPAAPEDGAWERFEAAVRERAAAEAAAEERGLKFWAERLSGFSGEVRTGAVAGNSRIISGVSAPSAAVPDAFRGSCFPYVLFSLHRAVREVRGSEATTVIAYQWRSPRQVPVAACFLNTTMSLDLTGPGGVPEAMPDFLDGWYSEIDYADVPFPAVAALRPAVAGSIAGFLAYDVASGESTVDISGVQGTEILLGYGRSQPMAPFSATATVQGKQIRLRLVVDEEATGLGVEDLGARWHRLLGEALSCTV
jgi:hypothetical protein